MRERRADEYYHRVAANRLPGTRHRNRRGDIADSKRTLLEQKFHSWEPKFRLRIILQCESLLQESGNPRWRDDDLTSNVFGSDARVDTLARRVGVVASRASTR
jgi:hypothetical protein